MGNVAMGTDIRVHKYTSLIRFLILECVILSVGKGSFRHDN
jgi:hypothetical protein